MATKSQSSKTTTKKTATKKSQAKKTTAKKSNRGGRREGAGRKPRQINRLSQQAREEAKATGLLPHEWLLAIAQGRAVEQKEWQYTYKDDGSVKSKKLVTVEVYADFETRIDAAKAAAPYYAPKLATQMVKPADPDTEVTITYKRVS